MHKILFTLSYPSRKLYIEDISKRCFFLWKKAMKTVRISKGLELPITGKPEKIISEPAFVKTVALLGEDYIGMRPKFLVKEGDAVQLGQKLFTDKKIPGIFYTSPATGVVKKIHLGQRRSFTSLWIALGENSEQGIFFPRFEKNSLWHMERSVVEQNLLETGLWTAFRTRPYSKVPIPGSRPHSIFVNAMDSNPLAPDPSVLLRRPEYLSAFEDGLAIVSRLTDGKVHLCCAPELNISLSSAVGDKVERSNFIGPHPAGLSGTHIHYLDPSSIKKTLWTISYQDVIAIGKTFLTGSLFVERIISLAGPGITLPRLIRTRLAVSIEEICRGELKSEREKLRLISGSVFHGRTCIAETAFLGRYHSQITAIEEGGPREFLGWQLPGFKKFSVKRAFASSFKPKRHFTFNTLVHGSPRAMVPTGNYESVTALDIIPTFLLRALIMKDTDRAQALGALELDEEDLALYTFVCSGKEDYGPLLRETLTLIEENG